MDKSIIQYSNDGIRFTRNLFLQLMCGIYLAAFLSIYYQSPGLIGNNGILPARILIDTSNNNHLVSAINNRPTLLHFVSYLGINTEYMIDLISIIGVIISFAGFLSINYCVIPTFASLWTLYYSLVQVLQVFENQSDYLLLEVGFICIILAPLNNMNKSNAFDKIGFLLLKWILFRFIFASGSVKFFSYCPHWWNFTAMSKHFETMPLPTSLSSLVHHLPSNLLKTTNIFTNISELILPWFFFLPIRTIRKIIFYWLMFLQVNIIATGNYGFLNYLLSILLLTLVDDRFFSEKRRSIIKFIMYMLFFSIIFITIGYSVPKSIHSIKFTQYLLDLLRSAIRPSPMLVFLLVIGMFLKNILSHPAIRKCRTTLEKMYAVNSLIGFTLFSITLISLSMVPHGSLDKSTNITNSDLGIFYQHIKKISILNEYGQHLRQMRSKRMEIIFEYTQNDIIDGPWIEYGFQYKPWNENNSMPFAGLYLPRLDFKLYDVVNQNYRDNPWILSLAYRLLNNEKSVLKLFNINEKIKPAPKFVRASLYRLQYTTKTSNHEYWIKSGKREYFPIYSKDNPTLLAYLKSLKISSNFKTTECTNTMLKNALDMIREQIELLDGSLLLFSVLTPALLIFLYKNKLI